MTRTKFTALTMALVALVGLAGVGRGADLPTVGLPQPMDLWLPGPEVFAVSADDRRSPVIVRIDKTTAERNGFRYSLVYIGLEAGKFDLRTSLRLADGKQPQVPSIPIEIQALRPPGDIQLNTVAEGPAARSGGYYLVLVAVGVVWLLGLGGLIVLRRRRKAVVEETSTAVTMEDRLRSLLTTTIAGTATPAEHAELERALLVYWVRRLGLQGQNPATVFAMLREHPEAGPLLRQLEAWLHAPNRDDKTVNVPELLAPYRALFTEPEKAPQS